MPLFLFPFSLFYVSFTSCFLIPFLSPSSIRPPAACLLLSNPVEYDWLSEAAWGLIFSSASCKVCYMLAATAVSELPSEEALPAGARMLGDSVTPIPWIPCSIPARKVK